MQAKKQYQDILKKDNPERYGIEYADNVRGGKWMLLLQIDDNDDCVVNSSRITDNPKGVCNGLFEGSLLDFCQENGGYDYLTGDIQPDIAILNYYNNNLAR